ncbi:siphovirus Gp157 family protein [Caulobacter sp. UC70_42]|uniref:siphovirus Gp157 family protein n=1 Tax=Caulobacter sp. UC70_42 TaxID=3374551 RepID=UPI003756D612
MGAVKEMLRPDDLAYEAHVAAQLVEHLQAMGFGDDDDLIQDMVEGSTDVMERISTLLRWMALQSANAEALKAVEADFATRRGRYEERVVWARTALAKFMDAVPMKKVERPEATIAMSDAKASVIYAEDFDVEKLSEEYVRTKKEADKKAIKAALDAGTEIPGARLSNGGRTLTVRVK